MMKIGIEALNVCECVDFFYCIILFISGKSITDCFIDNFIKKRTSSVLPSHYAISFCVNLARPLHDKLINTEKNKCGMLAYPSRPAFYFGKLLSLYIDGYVGIVRYSHQFKKVNRGLR